MQQLELWTNRRGGKRKGAGRKSADGEHRLRHVKRAKFNKSQPLHITIKLVKGLPSLRRNAEHGVVRGALADSRERYGMRLVHFTIQRDHLHLIVEAPNREAVTRGMQSFLVRLTKRLNKLWNRSGAILRERYHDEVIKTPKQMRNVLRYVLQNHRHHGIATPFPVDPLSSAFAFDGWKDAPFPRASLPTVVTPSGWLLTTGWQKHGLLALCEVPA